MRPILFSSLLFIYPPPQTNLKSYPLFIPPQRAFSHRAGNPRTAQHSTAPPPPPPLNKQKQAQQKERKTHPAPLLHSTSTNSTTKTLLLYYANAALTARNKQAISSSSPSWPPPSSDIQCTRSAPARLFLGGRKRREWRAEVGSERRSDGEEGRREEGSGI